MLWPITYSLLYHGITHPILILMQHCLSLKKNAGGPQKTTGNYPLCSLHVSYSSWGWKWSMGLFSPLYKCHSQSSVSKISKVSSSQGKLNHFVQNSPWRSSRHTSSTNIEILLLFFVEYIQCHPVFETTAVIKLRCEPQGYEEKGFA